jgi:Uma2 family endonuclease
MSTFISDSAEVHVPEWVVDLASFRRWAHSDEFPEKGRVCFFDNQVWIDMSGEQLFTHAVLKTEITFVLYGLVKAGKLGIFSTDGWLVSSVEAGICSKPDATFIATASLQDRVRLIEGKRGGYIEAEGSPDMVLEVVSTSSVSKDTVSLRQAYWEAGVREYWLVDGRNEPLKFDILRHTPSGYRATPRKDGWLRSTVFDRSFRLEQTVGVGGHPEYTLHVR